MHKRGGTLRADDFVEFGAGQDRWNRLNVDLIMRTRRTTAGTLIFTKCNLSSTLPLSLRSHCFAFPWIEPPSPSRHRTHHNRLSLTIPCTNLRPFIASTIPNKSRGYKVEPREDPSLRLSISRDTSIKPSQPFATALTVSGLYGCRTCPLLQPERDSHEEGFSLVE